MSGRKISAGPLALLALGFLVSCASTGEAPETEVAPAFYPHPGRAVRTPPVRAVGAGDHLRWVRSDAARPAASAAIDTAVEARVFLGVNRAREQAGLPALTMRQDLVRVARSHAADMARRGYFSHRSPEGEGPGQRAVRAGIRYGAFAENLARVRNARDPTSLAIRGWLDSEGHRRNLLDERRAGYRYTGVGVAQAEDGTLYIAQEFLR